MLFTFANAIANTEDPEKLALLMDMYETMRDLMPQVRLAPSSPLPSPPLHCLCPLPPPPSPAPPYAAFALSLPHAVDQLGPSVSRGDLPLPQPHPALSLPFPCSGASPLCYVVFCWARPSPGA